MHHLLHIFLIACVLMQVTYGIYPNTQNMASLLLRPKLEFQDPTISVGCFSDYILKSNKIGEEYGRDYNQCLLNAKIDRQTSEAEMSNKRTIIEESSQNICKSLSACGSLNTTLEAFHCHAKIGENNTKEIYKISSNASEYANILLEKYRIIDFHYEQCCKSAERNYVEATGANYRTLQSCLDGRTKSSSSTATTKLKLIESTTPQPITSIRNTDSHVSGTREIPETTASDASELVDGTLLPNTEEFAKVYKLFK